MYSGASLNTWDAAGSSIKIGEREVDILLLYILYQGLCDKEIMRMSYSYCEKPDAQETAALEVVCICRLCVCTDMIVNRECTIIGI